MQIEQSENLKIAVVLRTGRAILGMNQQELADLLGIAKSTVARAETMELPLKAETYFKVLKLFKDRGLEIDPIFSSGIDIKVLEQALDLAKQRLNDEAHRRSDRGTKK